MTFDVAIFRNVTDKMMQLITEKFQVGDREKQTLS